MKRGALELGGQIWEATRLQEADHQSRISLKHATRITTNLRTTDLKSQITNNLKESDSNQDHRTLDHSNDCEAQQLAIEHRRLAVGVPKHGEQKKSEAQETATVSDLAPVEQKSGWPKSGRGKEAVK